jgi:hypothetical protein
VICFDRIAHFQAKGPQEVIGFDWIASLAGEVSSGSDLL